MDSFPTIEEVHIMLNEIAEGIPSKSADRHFFNTHLEIICIS